MASSALPETLALQRMYQWEKSSPDKVAFTQPMGGGVVRDWTWKQAMDEVRRMAAYLKSLNFEPGTKIALLAKNSAHWMMADWAIWMAGHVSVPLYPTLAATTVRQILEHSESKLLFVGKLDVWDEMKPGVPVELPMITLPLAPPVPGAMTWDEIIAKTAPLGDSPVRPADELCTLIYTSGTTGMPKGVMQSFGTFAWSITSGLKRVHIDSNARLFSYLPLAHVAERMLLEHGALATGAHVFFAESLDTFVADVQRARPTVFFSVPRLWVKFQQGVQAKMPAEKLDRLLKLPIIRGIVKKKILTGLGLDKVQWAAGGAAPMPTALLDWYLKLGLQIIEAYGMTENCALSHATVLGKPRPGTVGPPYDGVQCRIDKDSGEIQIKGECLMLGYYKQPEATKATFTDDGWLKTGDKGSIDAEGNLKITGRVKDLFKTGKGKYVAPAPIEDKLATHVAIEACCVTGANLGQPLGLLMLNAEATAKARDAAGRSALEASLAEHLKAVNAQLDPHEQMDCLVITAEAWSVENDILTPTMKVKRNRIEDRFAANYETWVASRKKVVWI
ncbi:MAG: AMP-binding protein [Burkholderiales bacterium]|nr:AMP-binding protein [Burkholderiales bacterium]